MSISGKVVDLAPYLARPNLANGLNREELAALLEEVKALEGRVMARLLLSSNKCNNGHHQENGEGDCLVGAKEAAARLAVTTDWPASRGRRPPETGARNGAAPVPPWIPAGPPPPPPG